MQGRGRGLIVGCVGSPTLGRIGQQGVQQLRALQAGIGQGKGAQGHLGPGTAIGQGTVRLQGCDVLDPVDAQIDLIALAGPGPLAHAGRPSRQAASSVVARTWKTEAALFSAATVKKRMQPG